MGEDFVDDHIGNGKVIAFFRGGSFSEEDDVGGAIWKPALGDAVNCNPKVY
jgi:hypothetical protein